jgi:predicted S18 family serine protease
MENTIALPVKTANILCALNTRIAQAEQNLKSLQAMAGDTLSAVAYATGIENLDEWSFDFATMTFTKK